MEDNEIEQSNSTESTEAAVEPQETEQESKPEASQEASKQEDSTPFHQHPRWIEREEQWKERFSQQEEATKAALQRLEQLEKQSTPQSQAKEDALISRLKGIDPEFGGRIEQMWNKLSKIDDYSAKFEQLEAKERNAWVDNTFKNLCTENKLSPDMAKRYERELIAVYRQNPQMSTQELPKVFKQVHEDYTKFVEGIRRSDRESYVAAKKTESNIPASATKGKPVSATQSKALPTDPGERRQQMVKEILEESRRSNKI